MNRGFLPAWAALGAALFLSGCAARTPAAPSQTEAYTIVATPAVAATQQAADLDPSPRVGRAAPDFALADLKGGTVRLSELRGKVVLVNFWASWCGPCRQEMPEIEKAYQKYKDKGVVFLGVDIQESLAVVRQFVQRGGYNWTFLLDTSGFVTSKYRVSAIPTSFFIDRDGVIREIYLGAMDRKDLESKLGALLR